MFTFRSTLTKLLCYDVSKKGAGVQVAGLKYYPPIEELDKSDWPDRLKLWQHRKQPDFGVLRPPKMRKMLRLLRGPEEVHTELIYKGYGIKALLGGRLKYEHLEFIRKRVNFNLVPGKMFAIWRIESPWQPITKKSPGKKLGGGKGSIHHYVTPVKAERMIVEIGGDIHPLEAKKILEPVAGALPFPARVVSQADLDNEKQRENWVRENNINPYTMEYVILNNMGGCKQWLTKYDYKWFGRYK